MRSLLTKVTIGTVVLFTTMLALTIPVLAQYSSVDDVAVGSTFAVFSSLYFLFIICACALGIAGFVLWIYLIIDATQRDYGTDTQMLAVGIVLLVFLGFPVGFILYWALIMTKYPKKQ